MYFVSKDDVAAQLGPDSGRNIWLAALDSGQYEQGRGRLGDADRGYCCLGLACHLAVEHGIIDRYNTEVGTLGAYPAVRDWVGLHDGTGVFVDKRGRGFDLTGLNDMYRQSFEEIATAIRMYL